MTGSTYAAALRSLPMHVPLALVTLFAAIPSAHGDEIPLLRQGLWEYQRTAGTQKFAATECIDPSDDLRRQHAALARMGCKIAPVQHDGTTYTYSSECALKLPSGVVALSMTTVLTAESETAYRLESRTTNQGRTSEETITGTRVADCAG